MLEMASLGAKVMQPASIQEARLNRVEVDVRSTFSKKQGTNITKKKNILGKNTIRGISFTKNDAKLTLVGVKDKPGVAASIFKPLSNNLINIDSFLFFLFDVITKFLNFFANKTIFIISLG